MAEGCPWRQQGQHHADVEERLHNDHRSSWSRPRRCSGQSCRASTVTLPALGVFAALHTIRKEPFLINYPCASPKLESHTICSIQHSTLARLPTQIDRAEGAGTELASVGQMEPGANTVLFSVTSHPLTSLPFDGGRNFEYAHCPRVKTPCRRD